MADLPQGTEVTVVGQRSGWLEVELTRGGTKQRGFVSRELVRYVGASRFELPEITVTVDVPTVAEAFVELKRAERRRAEEGHKFALTEDDRDRIDLAISVLRSTQKYEVDETTFRVSFNRPAGTKTQLTTIEDFILFVEEVERAYPSASPAAVASEIRQVRFSDPNWELLVDSQGIRDDRGRMVDIETQVPIATAFDMKQIAPRDEGLTLDTPMGRVDIDHVLAGIDAALSGMPAEYPEEFLEEREEITGGHHDTYKNTAAYKALKAASGGDVRDFATWSGDLGQAYAEYLVDRYLLGKTSATLASSMAMWAPPEELRGDIHGFIAIKVWKSVPASQSPSGDEFKISHVLRDMYLVRKPSETYARFFERVSGKAAADHGAYITERSLAFARNWYAKRAQEEKGTGAWTPTGFFTEKYKQFNEFHALNESTAGPADRISTAVASFVSDLAETVK